jgi:hypothetical protein
MATFERGERSALAGIITTGRVLLILVFTGIEAATLAIWLAFVESAPALSLMALVGLAILAVGLVVEHVLTDIAVNGFDLSLPILPAIGISVSEAILWGIWLVIAEQIGGLDGFAVAAVFLAVALVPQHTIEDNILRGGDPFARLFDLGTIGFSVLESAGATVWLLFVLRPEVVADPLVRVGLGGVDPAAVGLGVLALALLLEHNIGVAYSRRR